MGKGDRSAILTADYSSEDITLFMPLWAHLPIEDRAGKIIGETLFKLERFGRPFGVPACASFTSSPGLRLTAETSEAMEAVCQAVHLPWNVLIGEGLLAYGRQVEASQLCWRLMWAVIRNLKKQHAFSHTYDASTGAGMGERNSLHGLAPVGLFLDSLGLRIESARRVVLSGKNPYPWPVTVKYKGLTVTRQSEKTLVVFPDGQAVTLNDPTDAVVTAG